MKQWIKLESDIMYNDGVRRMYADYRQYGLAIYFMLRLHIESLSENGMLYEEVTNFGATYATRTIVEDIVNNYGLFSVDDNGYVKPVHFAYACVDEGVDDACVGEHVGEGVGGACVGERVGERVDGHEPIEDEKRKEKEKYKKKKLTEEDLQWQRDFKEHYPELARMKMPLTRQEYEKLLARYTNAAIKNKLEHMSNIPDITKKYVSVYRTLLNWLRN